MRNLWKVSSSSQVKETRPRVTVLMSLYIRHCKENKRFELRNIVTIILKDMILLCTSRIIRFRPSSSHSFPDKLSSKHKNTIWVSIVVKVVIHLSIYMYNNATFARMFGTLFGVILKSRKLYFFSKILDLGRHATRHQRSSRSFDEILSRW